MQEAPATFKKTISVEQTAQRLNCSMKKTYSMIADGTIPPRLVVRLGKMIRVFEADLAEWHANGGTQKAS